MTLSFPQCTALAIVHISHMLHFHFHWDQHIFKFSVGASSLIYGSFRNRLFSFQVFWIFIFQMYSTWPKNTVCIMLVIQICFMTQNMVLSWHVYYGQLTMCILVWGGMSYSWASRLSAEGTCQYLDVTAAFFPCVLSHGKGFIYVGSSVLSLTSLEFRSIECRRVAWYIHNL